MKNSFIFGYKKAAKNFLCPAKLPIFTRKMNGGKTAEILKANNISQYLAIFKDKLK